MRVESAIGDGETAIQHYNYVGKKIIHVTWKKSIIIKQFTVYTTFKLWVSDSIISVL